MGEREFLKLLRQQEGRLMRTAWAILGQEADAWDALQGAVEQAWRKRWRLRGGSEAFPTWIRSILVNRCINVLKKRSREVLVDPVDFPKTETTQHFDMGGYDDALWAALKALPLEQRQVVALRYLGDMQLNKIAKRLGLPLGTVKSRLHRGVQELKRQLCSIDREEVAGR